MVDETVRDNLLHLDLECGADLADDAQLETAEYFRPYEVPRNESPPLRQNWIDDERPLGGADVVSCPKLMDSPSRLRQAGFFVESPPPTILKRGLLIRFRPHSTLCFAL